MNIISLFEKYYYPGTSCLLESASFNTKTGRYSIIAARPEFTFRSWGNTIQIDNKGKYYADPIKELKKIFLKKKIRHSSKMPLFSGGAVGYISYDTVRLWERIGDSAEKDINIPDIYLLFYDNAIVYDNLLNKLHYAGSVDEGSDYLRQDNDENKANKIYISPNISKEVFIEMVLKAKEHISAGDIYQANLSQRLEAETDVDGWSLYKRLRNINPSPFAGYMNLNGLELISCSPERLVKVEGRNIQTRPIAGTYPRGKTIREDMEYAQKLVLNPKERAEHVMLVDLERNDLGRVCRYGTVEADEFMCVESYSHVHHIVSNVKGIIKDNVDQMDVLKAVFPGGTITGCPKIRCMQIIDEIEPVRRNIYTGCMGWIGYNGNMDLNIIIRTILKIGNKLYLQAGAGIVADSDPEREYNETLHKARALIEAITHDACRYKGEIIWI